MTFLTLLHIINISVIMLLMGHLMFRIKRMKYSVYWSIMRMIRFNDMRGVKWLGQNMIYFLYMIFIVILFLIDITLIGQLMNNSIFNRPVFLLLLSPLAWLSVIIYFSYSAKKIKT